MPSLAPADGPSTGVALWGVRELGTTVFFDEVPELLVCAGRLLLMPDPEMTGGDVNDSELMEVRAELDAAGETSSFKEVSRESLGRFIACEESSTSATRLRLVFHGPHVSSLLVLKAVLINLTRRCGFTN
jgi:hypothetical protein